MVNRAIHSVWLVCGIFYWKKGGFCIKLMYFTLLFTCDWVFRQGKMSSKNRVNGGGIWWHQGAMKRQKVPFWTISFLAEGPSYATFLSVKMIICGKSERDPNIMKADSLSAILRKKFAVREIFCEGWRPPKPWRRRAPCYGWQASLFSQEYL